MNKEQIKSKMQSIEESIKEQTNELNKLRAEMDKPEKPTLEEMCKGKEMYIPLFDGSIWMRGQDYRKDAYLSRERAEKEKLRIKLSVIADYLNGGLFEPIEYEMGHFIYFDRKLGRVMISWDKSVSYGKIYFRTIQHAELATTYFTNDELIKMLK